MNKTFEKLSELISGSGVGDPLTTAAKQTVDKAFAEVAQFARTSSRGARSSRATKRIRILIDAFSEWRSSLSDVEQKVVDVKFGTGSSGPAIELTNDETGEKLDITKQMVAYHLKTILSKLESEFGSRAAGLREAIPNDQFREADRKPTPLREDTEWKRTLRWWRNRCEKFSEELSAQDLEFLKIVLTRLSKVNSGAVPNKKTEKSRPGRRKSPSRYFELRELLTENPARLERLTIKQRDAMRIGLALDETEVDEETELGFRRFDSSQSMTKENFNYLLREVVKRLGAADLETLK